jgi:hypothetical protein
MTDSVLQAVAACGRALRVGFVWRGDRFAQVIAARQPGGDWRPVLESVEGSAAEGWPPSPPLQSLSIEQLGGQRKAALLVGMAGRSHWSASIEAVAGDARLIVDLACRHGGSPGWLGSRYRWLIGREDRLLLAITAPEALLGSDGDDVTITPAPQALSLPTARWRFEIAARPM